MLRRRLVGSLLGTLAAGLLLGVLATSAAHAQEASEPTTMARNCPAPGEGQRNP